MMAWPDAFSAFLIQSMFFNVASEFTKNKTNKYQINSHTKMIFKSTKYVLLNVFKRRKSLTFLQNYTLPLFSLGKTNVCQLGFSQMIWQQTAKRRKGNDWRYIFIIIPFMCYLTPYKPFNLNGWCRGIGVALQRSKCWHLNRFHLHVLSAF